MVPHRMSIRTMRRLSWLYWKWFWRKALCNGEVPSLARMERCSGVTLLASSCRKVRLLCPQAQRKMVVLSVVTALTSAPLAINLGGPALCHHGAQHKKVWPALTNGPETLSPADNDANSRRCRATPKTQWHLI